MGNYIKIFEYKLNGKEYVVFKVEEEIKFGFMDNGSFNESLSDSELSFIKGLYNFIVGDPTKNIELSPLHIDNKYIKTVYNTDSRLYSFYNMDGSLIDEKLLKKLNYLFNNQSTSVYSENEESEKTDEKPKKSSFQLAVEIGNTIVTILVSTSIVLGTLPIVPHGDLAFKIDYGIDSLSKGRYELPDNYDYSFSDLEDTINNNEYLSPSEKEFLINGLRAEIGENIDYIDKDILMRNLSEFSICYHCSKEYDEETGTYITVEYPAQGSFIYVGSNRNTAHIYGNSNYNTSCFEDCDESTLVHEINHMLCKRPYLIDMSEGFGDLVNGMYMSMDNPGFDLEELFNELFAREYLGDFSNEDLTEGYDWLMPITYVMCEILDHDTICKYKFNPDPYILTNYLTSLNVDKSSIHSLYKCIRWEACGIPDEYLCENGQEIYDILKFCYEQKNGVPMENDLIVMAYLYDTPYVDESFDDMFKSILGVENIERIIPKGYVSSNYKKKHPGVTIIADGREINITDENRYVDNDYVNNISTISVESNVKRH